MGDQACWMSEICDNCGRFLGEAHRGPCPQCGAHPEEADAEAQAEEAAAG